jgi:hypothetical protein
MNSLLQDEPSERAIAPALTLARKHVRRPACRAWLAGPGRLARVASTHRSGSPAHAKAKAHAEDILIELGTPFDVFQYESSAALRLPGLALCSQQFLEECTWICGSQDDVKILECRDKYAIRLPGIHREDSLRPLR